MLLERIREKVLSNSYLIYSKDKRFYI